LCTNVALKDTKVIVDGKNFLYYIQEGIDGCYGGQYDRIASAIENFFDCFKENNIKPYVVFDGSVIAVDKKFETIIDRASKRVDKCCNLYKRKPQNDIVDPPFTLMLLVQKLEQLQIPFTVCDR